MENVLKLQTARKFTTAIIASSFFFLGIESEAVATAPVFSNFGCSTNVESRSESGTVIAMHYTCFFKDTANGNDIYFRSWVSETMPPISFASTPMKFTWTLETHVPNHAPSTMGATVHYQAHWDDFENSNRFDTGYRLIADNPVKGSWKLITTVDENVEPSFVENDDATDCTVSASVASSIQVACV
ncbi:hypothetical protein ACWCQK_40140 [Streptomyces sp. NPDC002306]